METNAEEKTVGFGKNRIEALTDGIFAIAMTLLVLGIEVPQNQPGLSATQVLIDLIPDFFHYALAFIVVAILWVLHHEQFHHIRAIDRKMLWINILALLFIALVPFSSNYTDTFVLEPAPAIFFSINLLIIGALISWQWTYATRGYRLVDRSLDTGLVLLEKRKNLLIPVLGITAIIFAIIGVPWSSGIFYLLPLFLFLIQRRFDRSPLS